MYQSNSTWGSTELPARSLFIIDKLISRRKRNLHWDHLHSAVCVKLTLVVDFMPWTFIGRLLLTSQNDKRHRLKLWNWKVRQPNKRRAQSGAEGTLRKWWWGWLMSFDQFYRLIRRLGEFRDTVGGHLACWRSSSRFHLDFCLQSSNFNDEHVCHFCHSTGQLRRCLSVPWQMSRRATLKDRATLTTFQRSQLIWSQNYLFSQYRRNLGYMHCLFL